MLKSIDEWLKTPSHCVRYSNVGIKSYADAKNFCQSNSFLSNVEKVIFNAKKEIRKIVGKEAGRDEKGSDR